MMTRSHCYLVCLFIFIGNVVTSSSADGGADGTRKEDALSFRSVGPKEGGYVENGDVVTIHRQSDYSNSDQRRQLQESSSVVCNRFVQNRDRATVCQDESTFSYCFVDNPDECEYVAIDWTLFEQRKAQYEGPVRGDLDLFIAQTFFACPCDGSIPDCTTSEFSGHGINACKEAAENFINCEVEDGIEKCNGREDGRSYRCSRPPSTTAGVVTTSCCTIATALEPRTCVNSVLTFSNTNSDTNNSDLLSSCRVDVDDVACTCSVCGGGATGQSSDNSISYDCTAAGRDDLVEACPPSSGGGGGVEEFYGSKMKIPLGYIEPLGPAVTAAPSSSPTVRITPSPSASPSRSAAPSLSQTPTMKFTPPPTASPAPSDAPSTSPPTKAPTEEPSSAPSGSPTTTKVPSSAPTASALPTFFPTKAPSISPSSPPSSAPTGAPTPEFVADCEGIHLKIRLLNEGYGDLECEDYDGDFPGAIYACSVTTSLRNGVVGFDIEPTNSLRRPFQRKCEAAAPDGLVFFCLDNVGSDFETFKGDTSDADLGCEADYTFPEYNLLQGVSADSKRSDQFEDELAINAYFVEFLGDPTATSTAAKGLDSAAPSKNIASIGHVLATSFLMYFLSSFC